jgi:hypothetical protein
MIKRHNNCDTVYVIYESSYFEIVCCSFVIFVEK